MFYQFALLFSLGVAACSANTSNEPADGINEATTAAADTTSFKVVKLYEDLSNPWGMTWLSDGRMLVTERNGDILVFKGDKFTGEKLSGVPKVVAQGQGGLLDIQTHPAYAQNGWIYITYSKPMPGGSSTAVTRFKLQGNQVVNAEDVFVAKPALNADYHFGSRIVWDKAGFMYVSVGERGTQPKVQQLDNDHGKIHRIYDDGRIPEDNPFAKQAGASKSIWSYGHRNPQGMVYDAAGNRIWAIEHGPKGGDELNLVEPGKNYGWPKTSYGINYDGTILTKDKELPGVTNPVRNWVPSIAPCGMAIVTSDRYPGWKGNLLVGALSFRYVARVQMDGAGYKGEEKLLENIGRVRHVAQSPDGYIYVLTEGPGQLIKLQP